MCAITMVLQCFLKGYVGAMPVIRSDGCELAIFCNSRKVDFCEILLKIDEFDKNPMKRNVIS